jgi:hypothetical protein
MSQTHCSTNPSQESRSPRRKTAQQLRAFVCAVLPLQIVSPPSISLQSCPSCRSRLGPASLPAASHLPICGKSKNLAPSVPVICEGNCPPVTGTVDETPSQLSHKFPALLSFKTLGAQRVSSGAGPRHCHRLGIGSSGKASHSQDGNEPCCPVGACCHFEPQVSAVQALPIN